MEYRKSCIVDREPASIIRSNDRGVTLVELLVVISIVGLVIIALGFEYSGWQGRYKVESATKTLYSDLMSARVQAMERCATYLVDFPARNPALVCDWSYRVANDTHDSSGNPIPDGIIQQDEVLDAFKCPRYNDPSGSRTPSKGLLEYPINGGALITLRSKELICSGTPPVLIASANPLKISLTSTVKADFDCIIMEQARINLGQTDSGGVCIAK